MPWQLIYTSAPRGLLSGQSGFCTVARSADLREALVQRLEQISSYHYLRVSAVGTDGGNPTISAFRIVDVRGAKYQVLTRIQPCGLDFTARTNHLARHLIFQPGELAQVPSPAAILRGWSGWSAGWQGEPRLLDDVPLEEFREIKKPTFPANAWLQMTGDAGRAAGLLESECVRGCYLICPAGGEQQLLDMFAETLQLLDHTGQYPLRPWRYSFTTFMQAEDNPLDFQWRGCQEGTPAFQQAAQRSAPMLPVRSVRVPNNSLTKIARENPRKPLPPAGTAPGRAATLVRREPFTTGKAAPVIVAPVGVRGAPVASKKERLLSMSLWIDSSTAARLSIFVAVLLVLIAARLWLNRHRVAPEVRTTVIAEPPPRVEAPAKAELPRQAPEPASPNPVPPPAVSAAPVDLKELDPLWIDGPTYLVLASNMSRFNLPIQNNIRFQNLISRYDSLSHPQVQLMLGADQWELSSEKQFPIRAGPGKVLTAANGDAQCVFDYSHWLPQHDVVQANAPIIVQFALGTEPHMISARFTFSSTNDGDAFRLLVINPNFPPNPLILPRNFLAAGAPIPALEQRLSQMHFPGGAAKRYVPFVKTKDGARYLYEDWPPEEKPPADAELDFASVKNRLASRQATWKKEEIVLKQKLRQWPKDLFATPLGNYLASTNTHLAAFANFADDHYSARRFIEYLDALKKGPAAVSGWPVFRRDAEADDRATEFERLYNRLTDGHPEIVGALTVDNTNYFYATWTNLTAREAVRQEAESAAAELQKLQDRINSVPDGLDGTAYVGLFIVESQEAHPPVEMIRFQ